MRNFTYCRHSLRAIHQLSGVHIQPVDGQFVCLTVTILCHHCFAPRLAFVAQQTLRMLLTVEMATYSVGMYLNLLICYSNLFVDSFYCALLGLFITLMCYS